ncbi:hypothetical protein QMK33_00355 [Hymenobacter sp. H14-R3]|uniref:hypothetical protein n=1 Tax=Hymenobacter sp. H14-R3 TaxID=3046308 RepID=UPI0024BAE68A|nr:hypothetical protein [Hymenobacter sp. H14-R3]MDJ0363585.1 hypothetical protein [Hymenobacter sp. H14-R3]
MARDNSLLIKRNKEIRAAYNRLTAEEVIAVFKGRRVAMKLNYEQIMTMLGNMFFLSPRTIEPIITATAPKMAAITSTAHAA